MLQKLFRIRNQHLREFLAEMFATLFLVACVTGSIAQGFITSQLPMLLTYASCGFGCAISGLIFGKVSGKLTRKLAKNILNKIKSIK